MKQLFLMLTIVALATTMSFAQNEEEITGTKMVLDSTIIQDTKLMLAYNRLYSEGGIIDVISKEASREKAENGEIKKAAATQKFLENINQAYNTYASKFIKVDTVYVDSLKLVNQITKIQNWQQKVLNDPEIKETTSLSIWEQKTKRLEKLLYYQKQLTK